MTPAVHAFASFIFLCVQSEKCLRAHKHYCILEAPKDGVRFSTSVLDDLNQDFLSLKRDYSTTQATLVGEVMKIAAGYSDPMLSLNCILAQLDVFFSFAHASAMAPTPYVRPVITPKGLCMCSTVPILKPTSLQMVTLCGNPKKACEGVYAWGVVVEVWFVITEKLTLTNLKMDSYPTIQKL